uniref:Zinc finger, SWIM-type n=1 Tax=Tanacetum cinerariifolium TaxID=118510 RepID=A0A699INR0_TANCI|nr:zinc finger, SWIM-type [Tanacetum cinerariifolium]
MSFWPDNGCKKEKIVKPPKPPAEKGRPTKTSVEEPPLVDVSDIPAFVNVVNVEGSNAPKVVIENIGNVGGSSVRVFVKDNVGSSGDNVMNIRSESRDRFMTKVVGGTGVVEHFRKEGIHFDSVQVYGKIVTLCIAISSPRRVYVEGKVNYVDNIDVDLFNVDEVHMFVYDLGYDPKQLMFYHFKLPNKSLDYGLRPLSGDEDVVSLINIVGTFNVVEVFIEYWLTRVDHRYLSPFKPNVEIKELDDDVELNAYVVGSSKRLVLVNVNEEQLVNVNDYTVDDSYEFNTDDNLNLDDYTVYVDENMNVNVDENVNVHENEYVNADENENVNADDEQNSDEENKHNSSEDEEGRGDERRFHYA